jgi:hypothetical protein
LADGNGTEEMLLGKDFDDASATPFSVSPDGKTLLFGRHGSAGAAGIYALSLDGSGKIQPFLQSTFTQWLAQLSPDVTGSSMCRTNQGATRSMCSHFLDRGESG